MLLLPFISLLSLTVALAFAADMSLLSQRVGLSTERAAGSYVSSAFPAAFSSSSASFNGDSTSKDTDAGIVAFVHTETPTALTTTTNAASPNSAAGLLSSPTVSASGSSKLGLSSWELLSLCVPVIPSQLGWAVGEALLIPYLVSLGLEETTANAIWLVNPLVGFFVQPYIGAWSDGYSGPWGRRRPFLFVFHFGIVAGLLTIGFAPELHRLLFPAVEAFDDEARASITLLLLIFTGCVVMELSNDLLTIPSRALLNDNLPEAQLEQGNAWFSAMNSLGAVIGLTMCFLPMHEVWPLTLLGSQLKATFVMCMGFIVACNLFTMTLDEWREEDTALDEGERKGQGEVEGHEAVVGESVWLLHEETAGRTGPARRHSGSSKLHALLESGHGSGQEDKYNKMAVDKLTVPIVAANQADEAETEPGETEDERRHEEEEEGEATSADSEHLSLLASILAFRLLTPALLAIWVSQFTWWLVVMQCSFWWTTWVGIAVYGGDPLTSPDLFYEGVTYGIIGTLVHSLVSLFASHVLITANNTFGVTRVYHVSAVLYSVATAALWWWRSKEASMIYMIGTGFLYPVINTNPFILIELHTGGDNERWKRDEGASDTGTQEHEVEAAKAGPTSVEQSVSEAAAHRAMTHSSDSIVSPHSLTGRLPSRTVTTTARLSVDQRPTNAAPSTPRTETEANASSFSSSTDSELRALPSAAAHSVSVTDHDGHLLDEESAAPGATDDQQLTPTISREASFSRLCPSYLQSAGAQNHLTHRRPYSALIVSRADTNSAEADEKAQTQHRSQQSTNRAPIGQSPPLTSLNIPTISKSTSSQLDRDGEMEATEAEEGGETKGAAGTEPLQASTHRGVLTALMNLSMGLSQIVSATLGGALINWWGDITVVFVVSGTLCVAVNGVVALYGLSSERTVAAAEKGTEKRVAKADLATARSEETSRMGGGVWRWLVGGGDKAR